MRKGPKGQGQTLQPTDYEWKVPETEHVLGCKSEQTDDTEWSGSG